MPLKTDVLKLYDAIYVTPKGEFTTDETKGNYYGIVTGIDYKGWATIKTFLEPPTLPGKNQVAWKRLRIKKRMHRYAEKYG